MSRVVEDYVPGMIVPMSPREAKEYRKKALEEKRAILREFGHGDVDPVV